MEDYPDVSDPLFYKKLYRKAEIWMHHEEQQTFEKLSHPQLFLRDYLNPHTPYRGLLVVADVGAGKTCAALQVAEQFKSYGRKVVILTKASLVEQFRREFLMTCSGNTYLSNDEKAAILRLGHNERKIALRQKYKILKRFFIIQSFDTFFNKPRNIDHMLLIIDEIHNFREESNRLEKLQKLLDVSIDTRMLLLSATPMVDSVNEIIDILKLFGITLKQDYVNDPLKYKTEIINLVRGYISYFAADESFIPKRIDVGNVLDDITKFTKLFVVEMSEEQKNIYSQINKSDDLKSINVQRNASVSFKLEHLVKQISRSPGPVVVFTEFVKGLGGVNNIAKHLRKNGLHADILSGDVSDSQRQQTIQAFNQPDTTNRVLVITKVGSEGINLKNVRQCHILCPLWNISSMEQIIGRTIRLFSHSGLAIEDRSVHVFLWCVKDTIDEHVYHVAEEKDILIQHMMQVLKQSAIDCVLFKHLNEKQFIDAEDYSRRCFYGKCTSALKCAYHVSEDTLGEDVSTLVVRHGQRQNIEREVLTLLKNKQGLQDIHDFYKSIQVHPLILLDVLDTMVLNNTLEKYGSLYSLRQFHGSVKPRLLDVLILRDVADIPHKYIKIQAPQQQQEQMMSQSTIREKIRNVDIKTKIAGFVVNNTFRIIDRRDPEMSGNLKKIHTGQVCNTMPVDKLKDIYDFLQIQTHAVNRTDLCSSIYNDLQRRGWLITI